MFHLFAQWLARLDWTVLIVVCLTLGLAPFAPPHIWEKLSMLVRGKLVRPLDWLDFTIHGAPWVLLILKGIVEVVNFRS
ncbi:MAG: RND transporter [Deltaproteobacteria bacterium]|nr:RND transporter [Deltaproteobacteria bacterium]